MSSPKVGTASNAIHDTDDGPQRKWLYPTTPCRTKRYEPRDSNPGPPHEFALSAGKYLGESHGDPAPPYNGGREWQKFTHPEGKIYHVTGFSPRVVTEGEVTTGRVSRAVHAWADLILAWAEELEFQLTESNELFVDVEDDAEVCDYYFIDHRSRTVCWLEDSDTSELGLPSACSDHHLRHALEENYWKHVEMFGMHLSAQTFVEDPVKQLIGVYLHGQADLATSGTSTFYFSPEVTETHLKVLERCQAIQDDPIIYSFVGRLWGFVCNYRLQNFHGEDHCRLDRTTSVLQHVQERPPAHLRFISTVFLFGLPEPIRLQLHEQLVDGLVVERVWTAFIADQTTAWTAVMQRTLALVLANALLAAISPVPIVAHISLVLNAIGMLLSALLSQRFQSLASDADDACTFLSNQNGTMMPLAMIFSLPRAVFIWSLIILAAEAITILFHSVPPPVGISICVAVPLLALCIGWFVFPVQRLAIWERLTGLFKFPHLGIPFTRSHVKLPDAESCDAGVALA